MMDRIFSGCALVAGIVLLLMIVAAMWLLALFAPGVRDVIDALR